jgi:predicted O-methyltransferase YrrM
MDDQNIVAEPPTLKSLLDATATLGFAMSSDRLTGSLLRSLAASKPGGQFLELGTGTGVGTSWILAGMDAASTLITVDNDTAAVGVARQFLGDDSRVTFYVEDGASFLKRSANQRFDFIFADTWPGKFSHLDETLTLLKPGGLYIIDDLLPQPNWPEGHAPKVSTLIAALESRQDLVVTKLGWSTGLLIATKWS